MKEPHSFHYHPFTEHELEKLAEFSRRNGWELDHSPSTENDAKDIWWRHGGTYALKRERDLFDELSPLL